MATSYDGERWASPTTRNPQSSGLAAGTVGGWGLFNVVEGTVDPRLLGLHHVRDDIAEPLWWNLGFLALGAILLGAGTVLVWPTDVDRVPRASSRGRRSIGVGQSVSVGAPLSPVPP